MFSVEGTARAVRCIPTKEGYNSHCMCKKCGDEEIIE